MLLLSKNPGQHAWVEGHAPMALKVGPEFGLGFLISLKPGCQSGRQGPLYSKESQIDKGVEPLPLNFSIVIYCPQLTGR